MEELAVYESESKSPSALIAMALDKQADPEVLKKLMDLQERWEAQNARKAFVVAMTAFKQEAPAVIIKNDEVDFTSAKGRTKYSYANLGSIVQEITALLGKHGLSATWQTSQHENGNITVTCHITHSAGHRESVTLTGPPDDSGNKNRIQAIGSCVTYLQRYTLLAALGLATDDDDDNRGKEIDTLKEPKSKPQPQQQTTEKPPLADPSVELLTTTQNIVAVGESSGTSKKTGALYTKYIITDGAKTKYWTFSKTIADNATKARDAGVRSELGYKNGQYGPELMVVTLVEMPGNPIPEALVCPQDNALPVTIEGCTMCMDYKTCPLHFIEVAKKFRGE